MPTAFARTSLPTGVGASRASSAAIQPPMELPMIATMRLTTIEMVRDAVLEGAGFAMLPNTVVEDHIADGALVHFGDLDGVDVDLSIVHPSRRLVSRRLRAFIDLVVAAFPDGQKPLPAHKRRRVR